MSSFNPVGPQGQPGPQGPAGQVTVASTATGDPGTSAAVTNVGTTTNAALAFVIPRGDQGEIGPIGPIGPKGDAGDIADRAATVVPGSTVALTVTGGDIELQIPSWINSMSVAAQSATTAASPSPSTLVIQDASISWTEIGGFASGQQHPSFAGMHTYPFKTNTIPAYDQIGWFAESFSAQYYGTLQRKSQNYQLISYGLIGAPNAISLSETRMTGTVRQGGAFALMWGNVQVATTGPTSGDSNMSGGNASSSGGGVYVPQTTAGTTLTLAHTQAGVYRTYTVTRTVSIPNLSVPVGLPDGTYTGTVSGYAFAQLPQWLVWLLYAEWTSYKVGGFLTYYVQDNLCVACPADFLGPIVTTMVPWSASGAFTVSGGSVQIPARSVTVTQSCPCYARLGPALFMPGETPAGAPQQTPPANYWNSLAAGNGYVVASQEGVSTTVPLKKGYFVSTISLSN